MLFYWSTCVNSSPSLLRSTWKKSSLLSPVVSLKSSRRQKKRSSCHQTPYNKNPTRFSSGRKHLRKYILSVYYSPSSLLQTAPTEAYVFLVCWYVCVILCCGKPWLLLLNILTDWLIMLLPTPAKVAVLQAWKKHETEVCLSFDPPWFLDDLKKKANIQNIAMCLHQRTHLTVKGSTSLLPHTSQSVCSSVCEFSSCAEISLVKTLPLVPQSFNWLLLPCNPPDCQVMLHFLAKDTIQQKSIKDSIK